MTDPIYMPISVNTTQGITAKDYDEMKNGSHQSWNASTCTCTLCTCIYTKVLVLVNSYILPFPILHALEKFDKIAIDHLFLISSIEEE